MRTVEPVAISSIFTRRDKDGDYTDSAVLYQNILRYSIVIKKNKSESNNQLFTWWEIADWLTANKNNHLDKPIKQRIENPQKTIKNKLQNLVQLELLRIAGDRPRAKGTGIVPTYQFTEYGDLLSLIIKSFESMTSREFSRICDEIYSLLCTIFPDRENSTSTVIFYSKFFEKCKERGVFESIVIIFRDTLAHNSRHIAEMVDLFQRVFMFGFKDYGLRNYFNRLFDETLHGLDFKTKKLVLYNLKLGIERKMRDPVLDFDGFEKMRFQIRGLIDTVALESHCVNCDHYIPIAVGLLDYRKKTANSDSGVINTRCHICNMDNSLQIAAVL